MHVHCEGASHHNAVLNDSQGVPGHIEAIAQGVPLAPEEQGDTAGGYTADMTASKSPATNMDGPCATIA
jgi:hypothetical protein